MNIQARLVRAEKRVIPADPHHAMSDDEIELRLAALRREIEAEMGMTQAEIVSHFEGQLVSGAQANVEAGLMRGFIAGVRLEAELEKTLGRPIGAFA